MAYSPSPSPLCLVNTCDVYPYSPAQDADGGNDPDACYGTSPTHAAVACSAQPDSAEEVDAQGRVTTSVAWTVMFGPAALGYGLKARDKLVLSVAGNTYTAFVHGFRDAAGRGSTVVVTAGERR
jgi:hypothetical protein